MTLLEKATYVAAILGMDIEDETNQEILITYLQAAESEILAWRYPSGSTVTEVPTEYDMTEVFAVVAGYSQQGAEGQTYHAENGITRTFAYSDMVDYIRKHVIPLCGVPS